MKTSSTDEMLKYAVETFAQTVRLKVSQFRRFVPKNRTITNTDLTGRYIEELVRGFIRNWIRHQHLLHGTFFADAREDVREKPLQVDGIVYDPNSGPVTLREGDFVIVHPAFCSGVIEVKMTFANQNMDKLERRLRKVHSRYFSRTPCYHVMGVVIADKDPETVSRRKLPTGKSDYYYNYCSGGLCPIFVLFEETADGEYEPFYPAIEAMIRAIYRNTKIHTDYFG